MWIDEVFCQLITSHSNQTSFPYYGCVFFSLLVHSGVFLWYIDGNGWFVWPQWLRIAMIKVMCSTEHVCYRGCSWYHRMISDVIDQQYDVSKNDPVYWYLTNSWDYSCYVYARDIGTMLELHGYWVCHICLKTKDLPQGVVVMSILGDSPMSSTQSQLIWRTEVSVAACLHIRKMTSWEVIETAVLSEVSDVSASGFILLIFVQRY